MNRTGTTISGIRTSSIEAYFPFALSAAFTLVSALAVEFILIGQEFSLDTVRRLVITDAVLGGSAAFLLVFPVVFERCWEAPEADALSS